MSPDPKNPSTPESGSPRPPRAIQGEPGSGDAEPSAGIRTAPVFLFVLIGLLFYWGELYLDKHAGGFHPQVYDLNQPETSLAALKKLQPQTTEGAVFTKGQLIFRDYCAACHQTHGRGLPGQFPPLVKSDWVLAPGPNRMIRIVLHGLIGAINVGGADFNNTMLPLGPNLSDDDIAAVLTFVRTNPEWAHNTSLVTPQQVKIVRDQTQDRVIPWTVDELLKIPVEVGAPAQ